MNNARTDEFRASPEITRTQYGAICWRTYRNQLQILLITSRDTGRWIIPKGWPVAELSAADAAACEAWEESGVEGVVSDSCIGLYCYDKIISPAVAIPCMVAVYPLQVTRLRDRFPEQKERRRKWFPPDKAAKKVAEPALQVLLASFQPQPVAVADTTPPTEKPRAEGGSG